jgi:hypothetical protein
MINYWATTKERVRLELRKCHHGDYWKGTDKQHISVNKINHNDSQILSALAHFIIANLPGKVTTHCSSYSSEWS